ncbi:MAG TPA: response regulator transcription factor [Terriglobus sp.]
MKTINVALIDDHTLFREGLRRVLESEPHMHVTAEAATFTEGMLLCESGPEFDIALIDYQLEGNPSVGNGLELLKVLRRTRPAAKTLMLTGGLPSEALLEVLKQHRAGVFLKSEPVPELLLAIDKTLRGDIPISSKVAETLLHLSTIATPPSDTTNFSERERLVLRLITEGLGNKEIAVHLATSESNVKAILQRLFEKTGVRSRSQLVRYVFEFNLELQ